MFWQRIPKDEVLLATEKRNVLTGKIALYCTGFAFFHFFVDYYYGYHKSAAYIALIGLILFSCYVLCRFRFFHQAKIAGLLSMNVVFVIYANLIPKETGVILYYFPMMAASSALFGPRERIHRYTFIALPFVLLLLLFAVDFKLFGDYNFHGTSANIMLFFFINSISSGVILILCIDFMLKLNESSERQLHQLAEEIEAKNEDLEKANAELDRFLYSTSHDLRSPLSSIKGLINVARYDTGDQKIHGYLTMMIDRVDKLEYFIKDIIDYSKNARTEVRHEPTDFRSLIMEVTDNLRYVEGADRIAFKNEVEIDHPVMADKGRLSIVLNNLIANAIKYHDLRKEQPWINVAVRNSNGTVKLIVSDNGSGIGAEHQQRIFEMFYRGTLQSNGSGLGLYIVKQAVEKMQGTIRVESATGHGASFFITVPVAS